MIRHFFTRQFLAFVAVGGTAALLHWLARIALSQWLPFSSAVAFAYGVGLAVAYLLNRAFVFPTSEKPRLAQARDFVLVNLAFFPVVWGASLAFDHALASVGFAFHREALAHGVAVMLPMFATFLIYKFFAFRDVRHES